MFKWKNRFAHFEIAGRRFGAEMSRVEHGGVPYLDRYILYIGGPTLRLHKFWRGDDDRAPHDHPWAFWTFPLRGYFEKVWASDNGRYLGRRYVAPRRFHARPAAYRHIVEGSFDGKPFYTFVITGSYERRWGFWPKPNNFVYWRDWPASAEQPDLLAQRSRL